MKKICFFVVIGLSMLGCSYAADRNLYQGKYMFETACKLENGIYYDGGKPMITHASSIVNSGDIHPTNIAKSQAIESFAKSGNYIHFLTKNYEKSKLYGFEYSCESKTIKTLFDYDTFDYARREDVIYRYGSSMINMVIYGTGAQSGKLEKFIIGGNGNGIFIIGSSGYHYGRYSDFLGGRYNIQQQLHDMLKIWGLSEDKLQVYLERVAQKNTPTSQPYPWMFERPLMRDSKAGITTIQLEVGKDGDSTNGLRIADHNILPVGYFKLRNDGSTVDTDVVRKVVVKNKSELYYIDGKIERLLGDFSRGVNISDVSKVNFNLVTAKNLFNMIGYYGTCVSRLGCYDGGLVFIGKSKKLDDMYINEITKVETQGDILYFTVVLDNSGMMEATKNIKKSLKIYDKNGKTYIEEVK